MATEDRNKERVVELYKVLHETPYAFSFYAALRRVEAAHPDRPRLGESVRPSEDPIRLGQEATLAFAPAQLYSFNNSRTPARLHVYYLGLFGPNGVMPTHLTEYVRGRERNNDDPTFARFADIFHHRMLSFFYRAWANAQPTIHYERSDEDRFGRYVASFLGLGEESLRDRDALPDKVRLHHAGHFARESRPPDGLVSITRQYFDVEAQIVEFVGEWLALPADSVLTLGGFGDLGKLGESATLGDGVYTCQHKFALVLGPMSYSDFQRFMPGKENLRRLIALVRSYCGPEFTWELRLILRQDEIPPMVLGQQGSLGRTSWLNMAPRLHDADDAVLQMAAA